MEDTNRFSVMYSLINFLTLDIELFWYCWRKWFSSHNYGSEFTIPFANVNKNTFHQNLLLSQWKEGKAGSFSKYRKISAISVSQKSVALIVTLIARAVDKFCTGPWYCVPPVTLPCLREHPIQLSPSTLSRDSIHAKKHSKRSKEVTMRLLTWR